MIIASGWTKTLIFIVLAPAIGLGAGLHLHGGALLDLPRLCRLRASIIWFRRLQLVSACAVQPRPRRQRRAEDDGHHRRRAVRRRADHEFRIDFWVDPDAHTPRSRSARCPAAGASSTRWGRRSRACSPSADSPRRPRGAISLFTATALGVPVSTTHTITGAIVGVGSTRRLSAVRWGVAGPHRLGVDPDHSRRRAHRGRDVLPARRCGMP